MAPMSKGVHEWGESTPVVIAFLYYFAYCVSFIVEFCEDICYDILIRFGRWCGAENSIRKQVAV